MIRAFLRVDGEIPGNKCPWFCLKKTCKANNKCIEYMQDWMMKLVGLNEFVNGRYNVCQLLKITCLRAQQKSNIFYLTAIQSVLILIVIHFDLLLWVLF